jgi:hypothetical protein
MRRFIDIAEGATEYASLIRSFAMRHPECEDGREVLGNCHDLSTEFLALLPTETDAGLTLLSGFQGDPTGAAWKSNPAYWHHTVVRIGDQYVDFAARQFDPHAPIPVIQMRKYLARDWRTIQDIDKAHPDRL